MENREIELLREKVMEEFSKTEKGIELEKQRADAEDKLKSKFSDEEFDFAEEYIDKITEFYFEQAVYIFHKASENK